jgi:starch synthase
MKVLLTASEAVPFVKTGGLGDVIGTLVNEYMKRGIKASLILPFYRTIKKHARDLGIKSLEKKIVIPLGDSLETGNLWKGKTSEGAPAYFIENDKFYDRDDLYGTAEGDYPDNVFRFTFYDRAVCETIMALGLHFDVIHCNDWQTGLIPVYTKTIYKNNFSKTATLMTIHNLGYQGLFWSMHMPITGLGWNLFSVDGLEFFNKINFLKGGILFADVINTVSKNYAKEILTKEYGFGLDGVLRSRKKDLYGIINGIDYTEWDPEHDSFIPANFSIMDFSGKNECKTYLQKTCALPPSKSMLIGMVTRLTSQKGVDLVADAIEDILTLGAEIVILGKGDKPFHRVFLEIQKKYKKQFSVTIGFDNKLAHNIYAGADIFLMPSQYEPCGLGQLIALRYGTIPVGRKIGGLIDTILEYKPNNGNGTGFLFDGYSSDELLRAVKVANKFFQNKKHWLKIQKNAMSHNFSWSHSAEEYSILYKEALRKKNLYYG